MSKGQLQATSAWCENCSAVRPVRYDYIGPTRGGGEAFELVCTDCASIIATLYFDAPVTGSIHNAWAADDPTQTIVIDV